MLTVLQTLLSFVLLGLGIGSFVSIVIFAVDVVKWHDKESKVDILPSNTEAEKTANASESESEVITDAESGEYNTSAFFGAGSES